MDDNKNKNKKLLFLFVPIVLAVAIFIIITEMNKKNEVEKQKGDDNTAEFIMPNVDEEKVPESKVSIYEQMEQREEEKALEEKKSSDINFFDKNKKEIQNEDKDNKDNFFDGDYKKKKKTTSSKSETVKKDINKTKTDKSTNTQKINKTTSTDNNEDENYYGFGVYGGGSVDEKTNNSNEYNYIKATLEESQTIKDGSQVVFLLSKDTKIDGRMFEKMSIMYGVANFSRNPDIIINSIQDTRGNTYPVKLIGYNEKFQRGLYYDGEIKEAAEEAKEDGINEGAGMIGQTANAVGGAVKNVARSFQNVKIPVHEGYMMYFKPME